MLSENERLWEQAKQQTDELLLFKGVLSFWRSYVRDCKELADFYSMHEGYEGLTMALREQIRQSYQYSALIVNRIDEITAGLETTRFQMAELDKLIDPPQPFQYKFTLE